MGSREEIAEIGRKARAIRRTRGLTLNQLAKRTHLSPSYISQIENGKRNLNIRVLRGVARALNVPLVELLQEEQAEAVGLIRVGNRRTYTLSSGAIESLLFDPRRGNLEVTVMELPPGRDSGESNAHRGDELTYVLRGRVRVTVGKSKYDLHEGDIIYYRSSQRHCWENPFGRPAQVLITNTPATF